MRCGVIWCGSSSVHFKIIYRPNIRLELKIILWQTYWNWKPFKSVILTKVGKINLLDCMTFYQCDRYPSLYCCWCGFGVDLVCELSLETQAHIIIIWTYVTLSICVVYGFNASITHTHVIITPNVVVHRVVIVIFKSFKVSTRKWNDCNGPSNLIHSDTWSIFRIWIAWNSFV